MSAKATFWAWEQNTTPTQKLVLLSLANFANDRCQLWYSYDKIAKATGVHRRTVMRACKELQLLGLLDICKRVKSEKQNDTNLYTLKIKMGGMEQNSGSEYLSLGGSDRESLGVVTESHQGSDTVSPKSNNEPNNNKKHKDHYSDQFEDFWGKASVIYKSTKSNTGTKKEAYEQFKRVLVDNRNTHAWLNSMEQQAKEKIQRRAAGQFAENFKHVCRWIKNQSWEYTPETTQPRNIC